LCVGSLLRFVLQMQLTRCAYKVVAERLERQVVLSASVACC